MFKFEISAATPAELNAKQVEWAREVLRNEDNDTQAFAEGIAEGMEIAKSSAKAPSQDQWVNVIPEFAQKVDRPSFLPPYTPPTETALSPVMVTISEETIPQYQAPSERSVVAEFDSRGLPWDARIHSSGKSMLTDGSWKSKKNASEKLIAQVEAELIGKIKSGAIDNSQPVVIPASFIPPVPTMPPGVVTEPIPSFANSDPATRWDNAAPAPAVASQPVVAITSQPAYGNVPIPSGARPAHSLITFKNNLQMVLAGLITEGKVDQTYIRSLCDYFKIKDIWNVLGNEAQCIELFNTFVQCGFITKVEA